MPIVKASLKGQVVIPAEIREKIGLKPGGRVLVLLGDEGKVIIELVPGDPIEAAHGMLRGGPPLTGALLDSRRNENAREAKKAARLLRPAGLSRRRKRVGKGKSRLP